MDLEGENIVLIVTFLLLISLVYLTGFIVWVCCRRSEHSHSNSSQEQAGIKCERPLFPMATPSPVLQSSQNFPLHAMLLVLVALVNRKQARDVLIVRNRHVQTSEETTAIVETHENISNLEESNSVKEIQKKDQASQKKLDSRDESTMTTFLYEVSLV